MKKLLLAIVSLGAASVSFAQTTCSELFFSEIVEGSGNDKAIEIYNPTSAAVNMSNYRIVRYSNGSPTGVDSLTLSGTLASHDVFVVVNGQTTSQTNSPACSPALQAMADQLGGPYPDPMYQNGDDAICLVRINPYAIIDIFGKIGEDPGQSWSDVFPYTDAQGAWWTKDHTLQRKNTVQNGVTVNPTAFNVTAEYDSLPVNTWTGLGQHDCLCNTVGVNETTKNLNKVVVFPNPSSGLVQVNAAQQIASYEMFNAVGQLVMNKKYEVTDRQNSRQIDATTLPAGIYMLQVELADGKKIVTKISIR
ncbi:MAG: hypothetical protein Fur0041_11050 [Bacteroidia bacterium]